MSVETENMTETHKKRKRIRRTEDLIANFEMQSENKTTNNVMIVQTNPIENFLPKIDDLILPNEGKQKSNNKNIKKRMERGRKSTLTDGSHIRKNSIRRSIINKIFDKEAYVRLEKLNIEELITRQNFNKLHGIKPKSYSKYIKPCRILLDRFIVDVHLKNTNMEPLDKSPLNTITQNGRYTVYYTPEESSSFRNDYQLSQDVSNSLFNKSDLSQLHPLQLSLNKSNNDAADCTHVTISDDSEIFDISSTSVRQSTPVRKSALKGNSNSTSKNLKVTFNETSILIIDSDTSIGSPMKSKGTPVPTLFSKSGSSSDSSKDSCSKRYGDDNAVLLECGKLNFSVHEEHEGDNKSELETNINLPKTHRGTINVNNGFSRFGFKVERNTTAKQKIGINVKYKENKAVSKIRTNRRFELQMKMRQEQLES